MNSLQSNHRRVNTYVANSKNMALVSVGSNKKLLKHITDEVLQNANPNIRSQISEYHLDQFAGLAKIVVLHPISIIVCCSPEEKSSGTISITDLTTKLRHGSPYNSLDGNDEFTNELNLMRSLPQLPAQLVLVHVELDPPTFRMEANSRSPSGVIKSLTVLLSTMLAESQQQPLI